MKSMTYNHAFPPPPCYSRGSRQDSESPIDKHRGHRAMMMQLPSVSFTQVHRRNRALLLLMLVAVAHVALDSRASSQLYDECKVHSFGFNEPTTIEEKGSELSGTITTTMSKLQKSRVKAAVALRKMLPESVRDVNVTEKTAVARRTVAFQTVRGYSAASRFAMRFKRWVESRGVPMAQQAAHKVRNGSEVAFKRAKMVTRRAASVSNRTLAQ
eukprot:1693456-Amphidinium_carterae.1